MNDGLKEMRKALIERMEDLYSYWLLEEYTAEIGNDKDKHLDMISDGYAYEEFEEWLEEAR